MSLAKDIYYTACAALPMQLLKSLAPPSTLLPYHHTVSDEILLHIKHLYNYKNIKEFTSDLDYLLKYFKPVSPQDVLDAVNRNKQLPANAFLMTFDDGFKEVYHVIAPILQAKGVPAIFFINPAFIDNKILFYRSKTSLLIDELLKNNHNRSMVELFGRELDIQNPTPHKIIHTFRSSKKFTAGTVDRLAEKIGYSFVEYLQTHTPFLTTGQVNALHTMGFTIGAHSWDHPYYGNLNREEQMAQTTSSCDYVKTNFNSEKKYFSFPYSDEALPQSLFNDLSKTDIDLFFGIQNQKEELNNRMLHRFNAERPELPMHKQLKGVLALMAVQKLMNKNKVLRN